MSDDRTNSGAAARLITPEATLRATRLARTGRVLALGQSFGESMPQLADCPDVGHSRRLRRQAFLSPTPEAWSSRGLDSGPRISSEWLEMSTHSGTHIDALGHWSTRDQQFGGIAVDENWAESGMQRLGLEECLPIVTRGILLDVARVRGVARLEGGDLIHPDDLQRAAAQAGIEISPADVALVRTGWAQWWSESAVEYMSAAPGLTRAAANWLADRGVVAIGADTWVVDAVPPENPAEQRAVHEVCLVERGINLIENLNLEDLAREQASEFLFACLPPRFMGGTGFPVMPVAIL
jgi:kynurenine formamidase